MPTKLMPFPPQPSWDIEPRPTGTDLVRAIIEITKGRRSKFEICKHTGLLKLDRYLYSAAHYPGDYGFVPRTLAEDGDPLDVLVMVNEPTFSGCLIETRVIGMLRMRDKGDADDKLLAVPGSDPLFAGYTDLASVPPHYLREVEHFFSTYKTLEGGGIETLGWCGAADAMAELQRSIDRHAARGRTP